ncbi:uncharacterized protein K489DRAFT_314894 [Dissoconium aciculare CBS 342.82]|uniref:Aerobactin siderophore biosynthesis IucA/IucC-like C-terminal domain-containing protein n=1 Tax=Dissoconium aciculare CBS 342.82 TaxID=1314786 RepID=A0A6J3MCC9_9PEZI|nr:uncharacterized protein K489DRAFT_314894 [Dissoconium aciculare CBS 342.82]KAF1825676.1 hypothetical protein K489DRAFT_314894 [Dissoconium aciculare CBS 342.82]
MGRSLVAACGLPQMLASDAPMLSQPSISFLAVDRSEVWIVGDFRKILSGLVMQFRTSAPAANEVVFPCLTRQISAILAHYGSARVVCQDAFVAAAQASLRTVTIPDRWGFPYHLKFSLSYTISSVLRAITPHSACSGPEVSHIVEDCMTADSWVCKEVAAITGSHADRTAARQITCIVREDHEARAQALGQSLIIVAALGESPTRSSECLAALTFGLGNPAAKLAWLKGYAARLIPAVCVPAIESGVGLEAHGQNTLVRVDNATRAVLGFCFRDFGSVRCHTPTLRRRGFRISTAPPDTWLLTESEEEVWDQIQHTAIHNNLQLLVRQLAVDPALAWRLIRDELDDFFSSAAACLGNETAARMHAYLTRPIVKAKALLRMRMSQVTDEVRMPTCPNPPTLCCPWLTPSPLLLCLAH